MNSNTKNIILLDGTSSSGKTSIGKFYEKDGYKLIAVDDFPFEMVQKLVYEELSDEYIGPEKIQKLISKKHRELMITESKKYDKIIFDDINQHILNQCERKNIYIVIVYASLDRLVKNILSRKTTDPRGIFVFTQYAKRYIKTDSSKDGLDIINRIEFIEQLKKIKYEFESENALVEFAKIIFSRMEIDDDNDHYIKLRDTFQFDYILNTKDKTPIELYQELKEKTNN